MSKSMLDIQLLLVFKRPLLQSFNDASSVDIRKVVKALKKDDQISETFLIFRVLRGFEFK